MIDLTDMQLCIPYILDRLAQDKVLVNVYGHFGKYKIHISLYKVYLKKHENGEYYCHTTDAFDNLFVLGFFPSNVRYISRIKQDNGCFDIQIVEDLDKEEL